MFDKTAISIGEQIIKLQERGLIVTEMIMQHIIYRISVIIREYWHSMQDDKKEHLFKQNSKFKDVISLYNLMQS
jgi:abortive infection bacteriophage resistance protein